MISQQNSLTNRLPRCIFCCFAFAAVLFVLNSCAVETVPVDGRIAVLDLTARGLSSQSELTSVVHALEAMGIPHLITQQVAEAASQNIILTGSTIDETTLTPEERDALRDYVYGGGTLIAARLADIALFDLFGVQAFIKSTTRKSITFTADPDAPPFLSYIDHDLEKTISLGRHDYTEIFPTTAYTASTGMELARFDDQGAAIILNYYGSGKTVLIGCRFADLIIRGLTNRDFEAQRSYSNGFEPSADVIMLLIKGIYERTEPFPVFTHQIPFGNEGALILTHDVDCSDAFQNAIDFINLEKRFGVFSTYNITTKYFHDKVATAFYNESAIPFLQQIKDNGYDLESHSVGHFPNFNLFSAGDPEVSFATYHPYFDGTVTTGATVFGEVKVSKELLDRDISGQNTFAFRAGHLLIPSCLPEVLMQSGYEFDSSESANDVLTNFPYFLMYGNSMSEQKTTILEIPVTLSDKFLTDENIDATVANWLDIIKANSANNAVTSVLIHTSHTGCKLQAEKQLLDSLKNDDIWIGDQTTFGCFWKERLSLHYSVELHTYPQLNTTYLLIHLLKDKKDLVPGITFMVIDRDNRIANIYLTDSAGNEIKSRSLKKGNRIYSIITCVQ